MKNYSLSMVLSIALLGGIANLALSEEDTMAVNSKLATFAGGCFWCMEPPYDQVEGVLKTTVGYTGGRARTANYKKVSAGDSGHVEAIQVEYDPDKTDYKELLRIFWLTIDPTDSGGQFADRGSQYETAIFYHDKEQKDLAEWSKRELEASGRFTQPITVKVLPASEFYPAEDYHQDYYRKNPVHYERYSVGSGRKGFIKRTWNDSDNDSDKDLKNSYPF